QHHEKTDQELESALAKAECLGSQELTSLQSARGKPLPHRLKVTETEALQLQLHRLRQQIPEARYPAADIQLPAFDLLVECRPFLNQHPSSQDHRQNGNQQANQQRK